MTVYQSESVTDLKAYLDSLILHGVKLGIHNIEQLMRAVGNPQQQYPIVHVAGTNGKGSVLTFLNAILREAGYRTGRFTSPHLIAVNERFLIDDRPIADGLLAEHLACLKDAAERTALAPTYFEMNTAVAFNCFAQQAVDIALIEVGMGGRFDATNIVDPVATAITTIHYDHTQYLGDTLEKIAFEKAGILKPGIPAVIGDVLPGPLGVIAEQAHKRNAPMLRFGSAYTVRAGGDALHPRISYRGPELEIADAPLGLAGMHQVNNAAVAIALAETLRDAFDRITPQVIQAGLVAARWPGRLERVLDVPPVVMDVAHNPAGCRAVADALGRCVTVFSVSSDKDVAGMLDILAPISDPLILTEYTGGRCLSLEQLCAHAAHLPHEVCPSLAEALAEGMGRADMDRPLLITGSIYAVGEARRLLVEGYGARPVVF